MVQLHCPRSWLIGDPPKSLWRRRQSRSNSRNIRVFFHGRKNMAWLLGEMNMRNQDLVLMSWWLQRRWLERWVEKWGCLVGAFHGGVMCTQQSKNMQNHSPVRGGPAWKQQKTHEIPHEFISGWWARATPLKNMTSSIGMIRTPIYGKVKNGNQTTNQNLSVWGKPITTLSSPGEFSFAASTRPGETAPLTDLDTATISFPAGLQR